MMIAMSAALSMVKVWKMPLGGSVTLLSMLPVCLLSIKYGVKWGFFSAFIYSLTQLAMGFSELMSWGMTPAMWAGSVIFDYLIAFTVLGLAGIFAEKGLTGYYMGISLAMLARFLSHFVSGVIFFGIWCPEGWNTVVYSICYNGAYMLPEMIFTVIGTAAVFTLPQTKRLITG